MKKNEKKTKIFKKDASKKFWKRLNAETETAFWKAYQKALIVFLVAVFTAIPTCLACAAYLILF